MEAQTKEHPRRKPWGPLPYQNTSAQPVGILARAPIALHSGSTSLPSTLSLPSFGFSLLSLSLSSHAMNTAQQEVSLCANPPGLRDPLRTMLVAGRGPADLIEARKLLFSKESRKPMEQKNYAENRFCSGNISGYVNQRCDSHV